MLLRVSKGVATPKGGHVVLGDLPLEATEADLAEAFMEHLPCRFRVQLCDPETQTVSRTFSLDGVGRSPLEMLADIAQTWAPLQNAGSV